MRAIVGALALTLLVGCKSSPAPLQDIGLDAPSADAHLSDGTAPPDRSGAIAVTFDPVSSTDLAIGRHIVLRMLRSPAEAAASLSLTAAPCLLKLKGQPLPDGKTLALDLPAGTASADLVLFAPPDAKPGSSCPLGSPDTQLQVQALTFTVQPPTYKVLALGSQSAAAIHGMKATTVGELSGASKPIQALTYAAGSFGGAWFAASGDRGDNPPTTPMKSTVQLHRFTAQDAGAVAPWLDLTSQTKSPTSVEDMVWSPVGPCSLSQDALYLGAAGMDDPGTGSDGDPGGIYCFDANKQMTTVFDVKARALDVDPLGGFVNQGAKGALYVTRWGGYFVYPGGAELTDPAFPGVSETPGHSGSELRFARGGPHAGQLYVVDEWEPQPLVRISPEPHQAVHIADLSDTSNSANYGTPALCHAGTFGELLVVPREDPLDSRQYKLVAYFAEQGQVRELDLVRSLPCGQKVAFDDRGSTLAVITGTGSCYGSKTAHLLQFDLP